MILDTARRLYAAGHYMAVHCPACRKWRDVELDELGDGADRPLMDLHFRCRACGGMGEVQIRTPPWRLEDH